MEPDARIDMKKCVELLQLRKQKQTSVASLFETDDGGFGSRKILMTS